MYLHQITEGSVAEVIQQGPISLTHTCAIDGITSFKGIVAVEMTGIYSSVNMMLHSIDITVKNRGDRRIYTYPKSQILAQKKHSLIVGSILDAEARSVQFKRRYAYTGMGKVIHDKDVIDMRMLDISGSGIGFLISSPNISVDDTIYVQINTQSNVLGYEKAKVVRMMPCDEGILVGCQTENDLVMKLGVHEVL